MKDQACWLCGVQEVFGGGCDMVLQDTIAVQGGQSWNGVPETEMKGLQRLNVSLDVVVIAFEALQSYVEELIGDVKRFQGMLMAVAF